MAKLFKVIKLHFVPMSKELGHCTSAIMLCVCSLTKFTSNRWTLLSPKPLPSWSNKDDWSGDWEDCHRDSQDINVSTLASVQPCVATPC